MRAAIWIALLGTLGAPGPVRPEELPGGPAARPTEPRERLGALLALGPGANCSGPLLDLAVDPSGQRLAAQEQSGGSIRIWRLELPVRGTEPPEPRLVAVRSPGPPERWLEFAVDGALLLSEEAAGGRAPRAERIWEPREEARRGRVIPVSFARRVRDSGPGGGIEERLAPGKTRARGAVLPGQACGRTRWRSELPVVDGLAFDLRWLAGGCRLMALPVAGDGSGRRARESARARRLDRSPEAGVCRERRRLPHALLRQAFPGYARALEARLATLPRLSGAPYVLHIDPRGGVVLEAEDWLGGVHRLTAPRFPVATPLRRLVVPLGPARRAAR